MLIHFAQKNEAETLLNRFFTEQRSKAMKYLQKRYSLDEYDCEEIFQESSITLYQNIQSGKVVDVLSTLSTSTYFITICNNKALERLRSKKKVFFDSLNTEDEIAHRFLESKVEKILSLEDADAEERNERSKIVQQIVQTLPSPCDELLWGFYRDGYSMKKLAEQYGYASENAVKVTKHRCCEKFSKRYKDKLIQK